MRYNFNTITAVLRRTSFTNIRAIAGNLEVEVVIVNIYQRNSIKAYSRMALGDSTQNQSEVRGDA